jgi:hypothetical protein
MLNKLFTFIRYTLFGILLNDYLSRNYPQKYVEILTNVSYEVIRFYSKCQIFYNKNKKNIQTIIDSNPELKKIVNIVYKNKVEKNEILKVTNNSIYIKKYSNDAEKYFEEDKNGIYLFYDNEKEPENECKNIVVTHSLPIKTKYEVSDIKFISIEVLLYNKTYNIKLQTDKFNYYIVDNVLDLNFFKYYLYIYGIFNLTQHDKETITKLNLKIIDHNINVKELEITNEKFIIIKKNDYIY